MNFIKIEIMDEFKDELNQPLVKEYLLNHQRDINSKLEAIFRMLKASADNKIDLSKLVNKD